MGQDSWIDRFPFGYGIEDVHNPHSKLARPPNKGPEWRTVLCYFWPPKEGTSSALDGIATSLIRVKRSGTTTEV